MKNMALCNYIVSVVGLLIGALIMNAASEFPLDFTINGPGPGFWPFSLGVALCACAVVLFIHTFVNKIDLSHTNIALTMPANRRVYSMMLLIVAFCIMINLLGFYVASVILIPLVMQMMECKSKKTMLLTTIGTVVFIYIVFGEVLNTQMPESIFLE